MKKLLALVLAVAMLATMASFALVSAEDITQLDGNKAGGYVKFDLPTKEDGGFSYAHISVSAGEMEKGKTYIVKYDAMSSATGIGIAFDYFTGVDAHWQGNDEALKWQTISYEYEYKAESAANVRLYCNSKVYGTVLIDNFSIAEKDGGKVIFNSDFEKDLGTASLGGGASHVAHITEDLATLPVNEKGGFLKLNLPARDDGKTSYAALSFSGASFVKGKTYTITYDMMNNRKGISLAFDYGTGVDAFWKGPSTQDTWETITYDYEFKPDSAGTVRFYCNTTNYGMALVDNLSVVEKDTGKVIYECDFSDGANGANLSNAVVVPVVVGDLKELPENKKGGFAEFAVADPGDGVSFSYAAYSFPVNMANGKKYTVSYDMMSSDIAISVGFDGGNGQNCTWKKVSKVAKWETISFEYTPNADLTKPRVYANTKVYGTVLIDNVKVVDIESGKVIYSDDMSDKTASYGGKAVWIQGESKWIDVEDNNAAYIKYIDAEGNVYDFANDTGDGVTTKMSGGDVQYFGGGHLTSSSGHAFTGEVKAVLTFTGTAFQYILQYRGPVQHYGTGIDVYIDGAKYTTITDINGENLTARYLALEVKGLADKKHVVEFKSADGKRVVLDLIRCLEGTGEDEGKALRGDLDGDGKITEDDAIYALFNFFFPEDYPVEQNVDFDGDGKITSDDAILLLFVSLYPNDYKIAG